MNTEVINVGPDGNVCFNCPGCKDVHCIKVGDGPGPRWTWNGSGEKPTFAPSILAKSGHYCSGHSGKDCWCTYEQRLGKPSPFQCFVCHSFVRDGQIEFLNDCTHALAGQTVSLPRWDAEASS